MQSTFITHIDMTKSNLHMNYPSGSEPIIVGDNCYIGANSILLKGVEVGNKSLIAAGSLVNNNVAPNTVVGGVPAERIK